MRVIWSKNDGEYNQEGNTIKVERFVQQKHFLLYQCWFAMIGNKSCWWLMITKVCSQSVAPVMMIVWTRLNFIKICWKSQFNQVHCENNYKLEQAGRKFKCKDGEWKPRAPRCVPRHCNVPLVHNSEHWPRDVSYVPHSGHLRITCHSGFRLTGVSSLRCDNGKLYIDRYIHSFFHSNALIVDQESGIPMFQCVLESPVCCHLLTMATMLSLHTGC